jgi:hypothetical protein
MLETIKYIKTRENWKSVLETPPYNLTIKEDGGLIILSYTPKTDFSETICRECRGLIVDAETLDVVSYGFNKFFNYSDPYAAKIDWGSVSIQKKIDGSLIKVAYSEKGRGYLDGKKILISTNNCIFAADAPVNNLGDSERGEKDVSDFEELFWKAVANANTVSNKPEYILNKTNILPGYTYMFELCSPYNRVVVPHSETEIYHIGTRNNETLEEVETDIGIQKPEKYGFRTLEECIESVSKLPYNEEGYVAVDKHYNRVKIKSPAYVAAHHIISNISDKRIFLLIRDGQSDVFLSRFPEYRGMVESVKTKIANFAEYVSEFMRAGRLSDIPPGKNFDKEYAMLVKESLCPSFFFGLRQKRWNTPAEYLKVFLESKVVDFLERFA